MGRRWRGRQASRRKAERDSAVEKVRGACYAGSSPARPYKINKRRVGLLEKNIMPAEGKAAFEFEWLELENAFNRYLELKEQERRIRDEIKDIQSHFDTVFTQMNITVLRFDNKVLKRQERKSISYPDSDDLKAYLESRGVWHLAVSPDRSKIDRLIKAKLLNPEELAPFQKVKTTHAWVVEEVKENGSAVQESRQVAG